MSLFTGLSAKIFGGVAVASLAFNVWQGLQLSGSRDANRILQTDLTSARADTRLCNMSIDNLKQLADERGKRADQAMELARQQTTVHVERAQDILQIPVPTPDKECEATLQLLKDHQ